VKLRRCGYLLPNWYYKLSSITTAAKTSNPTNVSHFLHDLFQDESFTHVRRKNPNSIIVEHNGASQVLQLAMQKKKYITKIQFSHAFTFPTLISRINSASIFFACHYFEGAYLETATAFYHFLTTVSYYLVHEYSHAILFRITKFVS
jgi:sterol desaturase/sphingolipid hydroxylase (fatty acid hydroxylase superfamily)